MSAFGFDWSFANFTDLGVGDASSPNLVTGAPIQVLNRQPEVEDEDCQSCDYSYDQAQWHAVTTPD